MQVMIHSKFLVAYEAKKCNKCRFVYCFKIQEKHDCHKWKKLANVHLADAAIFVQNCDGWGKNFYCDWKSLASENIRSRF